MSDGAWFSRTARALRDSITHGTKARIAELNRGREAAEQVIDLSIGTLDLPADRRINDRVVDFVRSAAETLHAFAPVRGFASLRQALARRMARLHRLELDWQTEILITPGGIKGALTVAFHTLLDPGDEVVLPLPNWPHYPDMLHLHGAVVRPVFPSGPIRGGLTPDDLRANLGDATRMVILGDCINPTGKVYSTAELKALAAVIAAFNQEHRRGRGPVTVLFDCPYEAHVLGPRAAQLAAIEVELPGGERCAMRPVTLTLTGPGKTYGMHGDRIGYLCASPAVVAMAERVQVNLNSFASTYAQVATERALEEDMDEVVLARAGGARRNLLAVVERLARLPGLELETPAGGYFLFVDFSSYAPAYGERGFRDAASFLLEEARVATIAGSYFAESHPGTEHFVRINCGRTAILLEEACRRIEQALTGLRPEGR